MDRVVVSWGDVAQWPIAYDTFKNTILHIADRQYDIQYSTAKKVASVPAHLILKRKCLILESCYRTFFFFLIIRQHFFVQMFSTSLVIGHVRVILCSSIYGLRRAIPFGDILVLDERSREYISEVLTSSNAND